MVHVNANKLDLLMLPIKSLFRFHKTREILIFKRRVLIYNMTDQTY